jgi:signal transduction histidine kinase
MPCRSQTARLTPLDRSATDIHQLSLAILRLAGHTLRRSDFFSEAAALISDAWQGELVELWERKGERCYRGALRQPGAAFHFESCGRGAPGRDLAAACHAVVRRDRELRAALSDAGFTAGPHVDASDASTWLARRAGSALLLSSFVTDEGNSGLVLLVCEDGERLSATDVPLFGSLAQVVGVAMANRRAQATLKERVKELTCTYSVSQLAARPDLSLDDQLQAIAELLPPAWHYPEIAAACVVLDGRSHHSHGWTESRARQRADIITAGERRGFIEVVYRQEMPESDEGPFLAEERNLINSVARQVALLVERRHASEERAKLQEQLLHADRLATIGELAAGVAHELNEPLGSILGFAQLLLRGAAGDSRPDLEKIVAAALHAREIVKKLMLFARQTPPRKGSVDLNALVTDGLYFLGSRFAQEGIELRRVLARRLPAITADAGQLQQVLVNLAVNAVQAMPRGGVLTIRTVADARHVVLTVEDTGIGMSAEVRRRAFIPFFTTKEIGRGTGLGLAVVHGIVVAHGGAVSVESQVGAGSRFTVRLPRSRSAPRPRSRRRRAKDSS